MESLDTTNKFLKPINNRNSISNTTIITTVSKHDSPQQQQLQLQPQLQRQQLQQQQRSLIKSPNTNSSFINTNFDLTNSRLDSSTIQIDSINNNKNSGSNNASAIADGADTDAANQDASDQTKKKKSIKRNTSLINFKSFDFHIKSIYSGLRRKSQSEINRNEAASSVVPSTGNRNLPYLRVETVDTDESENPLVQYPQSPYQQRGSLDDKSTLQLLNTSQYDMNRSQASSPFLCPSPINIRRSSTSDIVCKKSSTVSSVSDSRRPSTSDLLRKARERKGSDGGGRIGRSISQGGLPRGGCRAGRRTSMAY